jgi:hypothetical protein
MGKVLLRLLLLAAVLFGANSCLIEIKQESPRWKYSLTCNGEKNSYTCIHDPLSAEIEYSVPEFFILDDGTVVFRFFDKDTGLKLQAGCFGPFRSGVTYSFTKDDRYFSVAFPWLYNGAQYECTSGHFTFRTSLLPAVAYTLDFDCKLSDSSGNTLDIRNGVFTVYNKVNPRNTAAGIR